jgi:hypothetical protein
MAAKIEDGKYTLDIPLDASSVEKLEGGGAVKVAVSSARGAIQSQIVKLDGKGGGRAAFGFREMPGAVKVILGPPDATDDEMLGLQTITVDVPARWWKEKPKLELPAVKITTHYWHFWLRWCRIFTISGVVRCPDGRPVPGAKVCAYDVDWLWWWSSKQLIKCAVTDADGAFSMKFRWCCGFWPWWWWRTRHWQLDPLLVDQIGPVLQRNPKLPGLLRPHVLPSAAGFGKILGQDAMPLGRADAIDPAVFTNIREKLVSALPAAPELEKLRIWPWWPWRAWADCAPDVIFKVTQDCADTPGHVILDETLWQTRWDISTDTNVLLVTNEAACCAPPPNSCLDGNCMSFTQVCSDTLDNIGGNPGLSSGVPAALIGYQGPGDPGSLSDRPFAGVVTISGTMDCLDGVDYYELEWAASNAGPWNTMPPPANGDIGRTYIRFVPFGFVGVNFSAAAPIDGRHVYETLQHYEDANPPPDWGANRIWLGGSRDILINWQTLNTFPDGLYYLRVRGWDINGSGQLVNDRILKICDSGQEAMLALRLNNRAPLVGPPDLHGNPCGTGTVHTCTDQPDTAFISVAIRKGDGSVVPLGSCGNSGVEKGDTLVIDFVAHDPDGHLYAYDIGAHYDVNLVNDLLAIGMLSPSPVVVPGVPAAAQAGPAYADALLQGAARPVWNGGVIRLEVPATGQGGAFPYTCCYILKLNAYKRTIVDCGYSVFGHWNTSEYSFTITV